MAQQPLVESGPPHYRGFTITLRHTTQRDFSGRVIGPAQRPVPDNTQQSLTSMPRGGDSNPQSQQASGRRPMS